MRLYNTGRQCKARIAQNRKITSCVMILVARRCSVGIEYKITDDYLIYHSELAD